jgi:hypothetical protein
VDIVEDPDEVVAKENLDEATLNWRRIFAGHGRIPR